MSNLNREENLIALNWVLTTKVCNAFESNRK